MPTRARSRFEAFESDLPPSGESGVMPVTTVRPNFDFAAYARESEERLAIASLVPTRPAPAATHAKVAAPTAGVSDSLRSLLDLSDPF